MAKKAEQEEEVLDEESQRRDQVVKGAIEGLIREYASELNAPSQDGENHPRNKKRKEKKEEVHWGTAACEEENEEEIVVLLDHDWAVNWTQKMKLEYLHPKKIQI